MRRRQRAHFCPEGEWNESRVEFCRVFRVVSHSMEIRWGERPRGRVFFSRVVRSHHGEVFSFR